MREREERVLHAATACQAPVSKSQDVILPKQNKGWNGGEKSPEVSHAMRCDFDVIARFGCGEEGAAHLHNVVDSDDSSQGSAISSMRFAISHYSNQTNVKRR